MTYNLIPNASAISEFIGGYNGDCGETAELALLHVINPSAYPLTAASLNAIVHRDITHGWASGNGSEPLSAIANDLTLLGIRFTSYGFSDPPQFDWRGMLAQWGGIKPIVFEYANAQALPGDERGVAYHFNTCLGWNDAQGVGLFADGDNAVERGGGTGLVTYSVSDLQAARVCGMLVGEYILGRETTMVPQGWSDNGTLLTAPNGVVCNLGFRDFVLAFPGGWPAWNWPLEAESGVNPVEMSNPALGPGTHQPFRATLLEWTAAMGVFVAWVGDEYVAYRAALAQAQGQAASLTAQLSAAQAQITALQAQLAAVGQTPAPAPLTPAEQNAVAAVAALKTALG